MYFRKKCRPIGDSFGFILPRELLKLSGIEPGKEVIIRINENNRIEIIPEGDISVLNHDEINYQNMIQHLTKELHRAKLEAKHSYESGYNQAWNHIRLKAIAKDIAYDEGYYKGFIDGQSKLKAEIADIVDRLSYNDKHKLRDLLLDILTKLSTNKGAS